MTTTEFIRFLPERFQIEWEKRDRSGIYGFTQRLMNNSNKEQIFGHEPKHFTPAPAHVLSNQ